jgi:uncharacterized protein
MTLPYRRSIFHQMMTRLDEPRRFLQVLAGPRQTGKTTLIRQVLEEIDRPTHYASADLPTLHDQAWIESQWTIGRRMAATAGEGGSVLVLDEIQRVPRWSDVVKALWDADTAAGMPLRVVLLGSAPLLMQHGLAESLAGRFEIVRSGHWSFAEMREAFGWNLDQFLFFGGYPGGAPLVGDEERWGAYVRDSLIETTISRDVLLLSRVDKPALLRQLFALGCGFSGEVLSYQKMVGQLQDAGNTTTLAGYLDLLASAGLLTGLQKHSGTAVQRRGSSPKLLALNTALVSASSGLSMSEWRDRPERWGRLVETAIGAHLVGGLAGTTATVRYWRERGREVDFVLVRGDSLVAVEVKSGPRVRDLSGLRVFRARYPHARTLLVGADGVGLEEFLLTPPAEWL